MIILNNKCLSQRLYTIFFHALDKEIFPGAAVGISQWNGKKYNRYINNYGMAQLYPIKTKLTNDTFFDLASLTKALATVPALLALMQDGKVKWDYDLNSIFKEEVNEDKKKIKINQLMSHCAGLPAHKEYYKKLLEVKKINKKKTLLNWILEEKLIYNPGTNYKYSDLGFILLGFIIEKISGENLEKYIQEKIFKPIGLHNNLFFVEKEKKLLHYAATEICPWTKEMLSGKVHDNNCRALGGVAGHAGLFGNIEGVIKWCEYLLSQFKGRNNHPNYKSENLRKAVKKNISNWTFGFDTPSVSGSSSGHFFSKFSFGHLGYTGTSFWIDPQKELIVVLLTNRVHSSNKNNVLIKNFRPFFHDTVINCLYTHKK